MSRITINPENRCLMKNGQPFFYQADTLWMAFSKLNLSEWEEILRLRRMQRYNVLQISALPISHDDSEDTNALAPFLPDARGHYDFKQINEEYFDKACEMLQMAVDFGFTPCIHLIWSNYVPDTWAAEYSPNTLMPLDEMKDVVAYMVKRFRDYEPLYSVTGDTDFETEKVCEHYRQAIKVIRENDPQALLTMHPRPHSEMPQDLHDSLDFYTFQGGHMRSGEEYKNHYRFAEYFWAKPGNKPVINTEPPYEAHGFGHEYGRFLAFDVRRAMWQSVLSGAQAGISYGAHGLWSMHRVGQTFSSVAFSGHPLDWRAALRLEGAYEPGFIRDLWERYSLFDLKPMSDLPGHSELVRLAENDAWRVIYVPYPTDLNLPFGLSENQEIILFELTNKRRLSAEFKADKEAGVLLMPQVNSDVVYLVRK